MKLIKYREFTIAIRSIDEHHFEAAVLDAPFQDRPRHIFSAPLDAASLERWVWSTEARVRAEAELGCNVATDPPTQSPPPETALTQESVGQRLYEALLAGEVGALFSRSRPADPRDQGLRLRLAFDLSDTRAEYLAALPWELLYDPSLSRFLGRDLHTPVVRYLFNRFRKKTLTVRGPLRILIVAGAQGGKKLDFETEVRLMKKALSAPIASKDLELMHLAEISPEILRHTLRNNEIHVLHFMGHGGYCPRSKMGAVFFATPDGKKDQADGEMLGDMLKDIPWLRLVVLNACKTARHAGLAGAPFYHGVASGIISQAGVPAVVANQYDIADDVAISFSEKLYTSLAASDPIDTAIAETRVQLKWRTSEWATPVLFLSSPDGKLFNRRSAKTARSASVLTPPRPEPARLRLGIRSFAGPGVWGQDMPQICERFRDLGEFFDPKSPQGRFIRDPALWQHEVFPVLRRFLLDSIDPARPILLDFAAHQSIAFAAGWVLEAKSGLDVSTWQRTAGNPLEWHPNDGTAPEGALWQDLPDRKLDPAGHDVALAITLSNTEVIGPVESFLRRQQLPVSRIIDATIAEPGQSSVHGGAHALRLAQALVARVRQRRPAERGGRLHVFGSAPNAFLFYLGQLSRSFGRVVLYEYAFNVPGGHDFYQRSIELPPPGEVQPLPAGW